MSESNKEHYDVIVVGAGPVGAKVASLIAKSGFDVLMVEEHEEIGKPVQCAGIVSSRLSQVAPISLPVLNKVRGGIIVPPGGTSLTLKSESYKALVIDRQRFDQDMVNHALDCGAILTTGKRCTQVYSREGQSFIRVKSGDGQEQELRSRLVIGADGPHSIIRKFMDVGGPKEMLFGMQAEVPKDMVPDLEPDEIRIYFGNSVAPGFFSWLIPTDETVRIGLCTSGGQYPRNYFNSFMGKLGISLEKEHHITSGSIPLGLLDASHGENALLVGDAACQVKPLTGGGLVFGLMCASHCAETATQSLEKESYGSEFLKRYHETWTGQIGKEIKQAMLLRRIFIGLEDREMDQIVDILRDEKTLSFLASEGDMDFPTIASKTVLRKLPKLIKFAPHLLKALL